MERLRQVQELSYTFHWWEFHESLQAARGVGHEQLRPKELDHCHREVVHQRECLGGRFRSLGPLSVGPAGPRVGDVRRRGRRLGVREDARPEHHRVVEVELAAEEQPEPPQEEQLRRDVLLLQPLVEPHVHLLQELEDVLAARQDGALRPVGRRFRDQGSHPGQRPDLRLRPLLGGGPRADDGEHVAQACFLQQRTEEGEGICLVVRRAAELVAKPMRFATDILALVHDVEAQGHQFVHALPVAFRRVHRWVAGLAPVVEH
mmetsp:Transcript_101167/g.286792  ORF Transcript_101167/g.286792 Transcript_101167/m.286792 type:complete len:261 (-) Transcript_101167:460-1242(-)